MNSPIRRKALISILAICFIFSTIGVVSAASPSDVKDHWAESTIASWMNKGFIGGYEDGTFRPDTPVSREEFTAFVNRSFAFTALGAAQFKDVAKTDWSYPDISKATAAGYISGYADGTFQPQKEISRQEVAVIIAILLDLKASSSADLFEDTNNSPEWSKSAIGAVKDHKIMDGYPNGTFQPKQSITRAEAVVTLDRALEIKSSVTKPTSEETVTIRGVRGLDFVTNTSLIITKENTSVEPISVEGMAFAPNNLYVYDMVAKTESALNPGRENQNTSLMSPDQQHIFYKTNREETAFGYIMNMASREVLKTGDNSMGINTGEWLDNSHVMFLTHDGRMMSYDVTGNSELLLEESGFISSAAKGKDGIYFVQDADLFFTSDESGEKKLVKENVTWVVPSPDDSQLAMVIRQENVMTLFITDLNGKPLLEIDSASQIFIPSWSPDGTKLVYNLVSETGSSSGIYVADSLTGNTTQAAIEMEYAIGPIRWSPSGDKFITSKYTPDGFVTYVVTIN